MFSAGPAGSYVQSMLIRLTPKATWMQQGSPVFDPNDLPFPRSFQEFQKLFPNDTASAAYLEAIRWHDGFVCGWCG